MTERDFATDILARLPFEPNEQQMKVALALARFVPQTHPRPIPTSAFSYSTVMRHRQDLAYRCARKVAAGLAHRYPAARTHRRAAKVFTAGAGFQAYTIHRKIYRHSLAGSPSFGGALPRENKLKNAIIIVDEASMIGSETETGSNLLTDLIQFVYSSPGCRLILMGDTAQLPPVNQTESPP